MSTTQCSMFSNRFCIVHFLMLLSVTVAGVEPANSALILVKTAMPNTLHHEHLNSYVLIRVQKNIKLDIQAIIDKYKRKHTRRILFVNPLVHTNHTYIRTIH